MTMEGSFAMFRAEIVRTVTVFSRDAAAAEDAVQQAYIQALLRREQLEGMPEAAMKAWLAATARNALVDAKRKTRRWVYDDALAAFADEDDDAMWVDRMLVESLLAQLPDGLSRIVHMRYLEGCNATEIAQRLDIPAATVRTRLRKALSNMRQLYRGDTHG